MKARHEKIFFSQQIENALTHTGHDSHIEDGVRRIRYLYPILRNGRPQGTHAKWDHVHDPSFHATFEKPFQASPHFPGFLPIIGRSGVILTVTAYKGSTFHPSDVSRIRTHEITIGPFILIKFDHGALPYHQPAKFVRLGIGSVTPMDFLGGAHFHHLVQPLQQSDVLGFRSIVT